MKDRRFLPRGEVRLSHEEEESIRQAFRELDVVNEYWEAHGLEIQEKYQGQWVVFLGPRIVANDMDVKALEAKLQRLGSERKNCVIRYVPSPEAEYVF